MSLTDEQFAIMEAAKALATRTGWYVHPLIGKMSPKGTSWKNDTHNHPDDIEAQPWHLADGFGINCKKSGICVLDIDDLSISIELQGFDHSTNQDTSKGRHFIYKAPPFEQSNTQNSPVIGIDIRGTTGQIRVHNHHQIIASLGDLKEWPLTEPVGKEKTQELSLEGLARPSSMSADSGRNEAIKRELGALIAANPTMDFDTMQLLAHGLNQTMCSVPLSDNEIKHTVISSSIAYLQTPEKELSNLPLRDLLKPLTPQDLIDREPPGWVIKDVLPKRGVSMLYGQSGVGKSFLALDMAVSLALGRKWRGQTVQQTKTVYLVLEGGGYFKQRLEAVYKKYGISSLDLAGMIRFYEPPIYEITTNKDRAAEFGQILLEDGFEGCQIIVDTYAASQDGLDENSNSQAQQAVNVLKTIGDGVNGGVLIVHHEGLVQGRPRGATALTAAMDAIIRMSTHKDKDRVAKVNMFKLKDGDKTKFKCLCQLSSTPLGYFDEDMEEVTSLVIDDYVDSEPTKINKKLSDRQQNMLDEITEMIEQNGVKETEFAPRYLLLKTLNEKLNPDERNFNTNRKIERLVKFGYLFKLPLGEETRIFLEDPAHLFTTP